MRSKAARTVILIIGGLAVLVGGVWIGQGAGLIKGSFMTGSPTSCYRTAVSRHWRVLDLLGRTPPLR
jgi:hypothetical protein